MNKWLIIIIILFIAFFIIPFFLFVFNIKEGITNEVNVTNKQINDNINSLHNRVKVVYTDMYKLNNTILTKFNSYEKDMLSFKNKIYKRLLIPYDSQ